MFFVFSKPSGDGVVTEKCRDLRSDRSAANQFRTAAGEAASGGERTRHVETTAA